MFIKILEEQNKVNFAKAQVVNAGSMTPRVGYLIVKSIFYRKTSGERAVMKISNSDSTCAVCEWIPLDGNKFIENITFDVEIGSLYHAESIGPKTIQPQLLIDKIVHIKSITQAKGVLNREIIKVEWDIINKTPKYQDFRDALVMTYKRANKTLQDIYKDYEDSVGTELADELIELEGDLSAAATDIDVPEADTEANDGNPNDDDSDKGEADNTSK